MAYKKGSDRRQRVLFPDCIDEYVEADAPVRLFDASVDSLNDGWAGICPQRKQLKEDNKDKPKPPRTKVVKKVVRNVLHLDQNKMDNRKCLSEHPFGTIKRTLGQYYFLLKGFAKVGAEMGLFCLALPKCLPWNISKNE